MDRRTAMMKLIVAFRNFVIIPKNWRKLCKSASQSVCNERNSDNKVAIVHLSKLWLNQTINTSTSPVYYSMTLRCTRSLVNLAHLVTSCWLLYHTHLGWFNEPPAVCTVDTQASVTLWANSLSLILFATKLTFISMDMWNHRTTGTCLQEIITQSMKCYYIMLNLVCGVLGVQLGLLGPLYFQRP